MDVDEINKKNYIKHWDKTQVKEWINNKIARNK